MRRSLVLTLVMGAVFNSCTFKPSANEPRTLTLNPSQTFNQDEAKLNATYSYLVFLFHDQRGESDEAQKALAQTLAIDPDSTELRFQHASDLFSRGLYASAREELLKLKGQDEEADKLYIQVLIREGNLGEARVALDKWLEKNPKDDELFALRARIELEDQNFDAAGKIIAHYLKEIPDSSQGYLLRGRLNQVKDNSKLALADYKKSLELDPNNVTAAAHLAFLQEIVGLKDDAMQTYAFLADMTDNPEFHKRLGLLYLERADNRRAIAALEAYARHQPQDNQNLARLAALYIDLKDYEQAEFKLKALIALQPDNDTVRYYYAASLFEQNKKSLALDEARKIKKESTLYSERLRLELTSMWDLKQEDKAKALAQSATLELFAKPKGNEEPEYSVLYGFFVLHKMKDFAKQVLDKGLQIYPASTNLRYNLALNYDEEGKWKEALDIGQTLLKDDDKNPALQNLVGYILADKSLDLRKAERLIGEALKTRPEDPYIMDSKAWLRFRQNRADEALSILEQGHKLRPDEPVIMIHMADILAKQGRIQDAVGWYGKAMDLGIEAVNERLRVQEALARFQKSPDRKISCTGDNCPSK